MSWLTGEVKRVRSALHIPPITLKNVVAAGAGAGLPFFGSANAALDAAKKPAGTKPASWTGALEDAADRAITKGVTTIQNAQTADTVVTGVKNNALPLLAGAAIVAYLVLRKR